MVIAKFKDGSVYELSAKFVWAVWRKKEGTREIFRHCGAAGNKKLAKQYVKQASVKSRWSKVIDWEIVEL
jgi:hypothetical protein